jgi:hypothetical protein
MIVWLFSFVEPGGDRPPIRGRGAASGIEIALVFCSSDTTPARESTAYHAMHVTIQACGAVITNPHSTHVSKITYAESEAAFDAAYVAPRRNALKELANSLRR